MELKAITEATIGAAIEVHRALGPGLLESTYEACLVHELCARRIVIERQKPLPVIYKGHQVDCGYRLDLTVEREVVVEIKSVDRIEPIHEAQLITYLRLSGLRVGLLINFNVRQLVRGLKRLVNEYPEFPPRSLRSLR